MACKRYTWHIFVFVCLLVTLSQAAKEKSKSAATEKTSGKAENAKSQEPDAAKVREEFTKIVEQQDFVGVLFTKECCTCIECVEAEAVLSTISQQIKDTLGIPVLKLAKQPELEAFYGIRSWPSFIYLRKKKPAIYEGPFDAEVLYDWIKDNRQVSTKFLDDGTFEHATQVATGATTGDWLIVFSNSSCSHGMSLLSHLEGLAIKLKHSVNVAYIDTEKNTLTKERFKNIKNCPSIWFFRQGSMYEYKSHKLDIGSMQAFAKGTYKNSDPQKVPDPSSPMSFVYDLANYYLNGKLIPVMYISMTVLAVYCWIIFVHKQVEAKTEKAE